MATKRPRPPVKRMTPVERRASILDAATEVFASEGYQRARMVDVAERLGVTEPVVFQNFGSKAALYEAVLELAADRFCAGLADRLDDVGSVPELLADVVSPGHVDRLHRGANPGVLFADAVGLRAEPAVEVAARRSIRRVARALAQVIERGQQEGDLSTDVDSATAAWWLLSFFASHEFRRAVMPNRESLEPELARLTLGALTGPA